MAYMDCSHAQAGDFDVIDTETGGSVPRVQWVNEETGTVAIRLLGSPTVIVHLRGSYRLVHHSGDPTIRPTY